MGSGGRIEERERLTGTAPALSVVRFVCLQGLTLHQPSLCVSARRHAFVCRRCSNVLMFLTR